MSTLTDISNRTDIKVLIDTFYEKVLEDEVIGHFFNEVIQLDLVKHMPIMYEFWESTLFQTGKYSGNPMKKHIELNRLSALNEEHFKRWISLFEETVNALFSGPIADLAKTRALSISTMLQIKIYQEGQVS